MVGGCGLVELVGNAMLDIRVHDVFFTMLTSSH